MTAEFYIPIIFGIFIIGILISAAHSESKFNEHLKWRREFEESKWREQQEYLKVKYKRRGLDSLIPPGPLPKAPHEFSPARPPELRREL
jgi:hypothetical protein